METARLFYTETYPQKVSKDKTKQNKKKKQVAHILPRDTLLRQIYFGFHIRVVTHSRTQNTYAYTQKKRLVTTPKGDASAPLQLVTMCLKHSCLNQKVPQYHRTCTHAETCTSFGGGAVCECMLEGRGRIKQLLNSDCET